MPFNIPILLTWLRITLIPLLVAVYYFPEGWVAWIGRDTAAMLSSSLPVPPIGWTVT